MSFILQQSGTPGHSGSSKTCCDIAYRMMVLGALAAIFLLLFLGAGSDAAKSWLVTERWTYLRAPLLATACFAFVCHAIAIRRLLEGARHVS